MATVGLKNLHYAKLTKDDATGVTYETPARLGGAISLRVDPQNNKTTLYADDAPFATAQSISEINVDIELADLDPSVMAILLGHTIDSVTGEVTSKAGDMAPYVGIAGEAEKHNGAKRFFKLLKGRFSEGEENLQTKGDSPEYTTPKLTGSFVMREYDGQWRRIVDSDSSLGADLIANWYASMEPTT